MQILLSLSFYDDHSLLFLQPSDHDLQLSFSLSFRPQPGLAPVFLSLPLPGPRIRSQFLDEARRGRKRRGRRGCG